MIRYSFELSKDAVADLKRLLDFDGNSFSDLVRVSGASIGHDFVGADLSGVDFSGADLRGYNFSSADLSKAVGKNVLFDRTTLLDNARTDGSIFAHEVAKRHFLNTDP